MLYLCHFVVGFYVLILTLKQPIPVDHFVVDAKLCKVVMIRSRNFLKPKVFHGKFDKSIVVCNL